jgi:hypothetical protein
MSIISLIQRLGFRLWNPMRHPFRTYTFYMRYACEHVGLKLSLFGQPRSDREYVLMMRRLVRIRPKFRQHDPDVLRCTISGVQSENSGVMPLKFRSDSNQASHHKHALSVTLGWVYDISFPIDVGPRYEVKKKPTSRLPLVCSLRNG